MLWAVTAYFNPAGYESRLRNYRAFSAGLERQGVPLLTVELAFGDQPFELPAHRDVLRIRTDDVMWQKERLLNIGVRQLPSACDHVAWLDCDLVFVNDDWAIETERQLERFPIVQPFEETEQYGRTVANFAWGYRHAAPGQPLARGFGWAARRELIHKHGLYDASIFGGGDNMIASAMVNRIPRQGLENPQAVPLTPQHQTHYFDWKEAFHNDVRGQLGHASGQAIHLEHGSKPNRRYWDRHLWLRDQNYDPRTDIVVGPDGCWHWNSPKDELHALARQYFQLRREDEP